jgi:MFS family permease
MKRIARGEGALLATPGFLRLWAAGGLGNLMRWLEMLASGIYVYDLTGSAFAVAAVTMARSVPMLLLGALTGLVADAVSRKTLFVVALALMIANASLQCALAATGSLQPWMIVACALVAGLVWAMDMPVRRRMLGELVADTDVAQAIALDSVTASSTRMLGPLAGGIAFQLVGIAGAFLISAVVHVIAIAVVLPVVYQQETRRLSLARVPADILEGLAVVRRRPLILGVVVVTVVMNVFAFSYSALVPPIGITQYRVSPVLVGLLAAAEPMGALIAGFAIATGLYRADRAQTFVSGAFLFLAALALMSFAPWYWLAFVLLVIGGLGTAAFGSMQTTLIISEAPVAMRSRIMGFVTMCIGMGPVGVLTIGTLSDRIGPSRAILTMALLGLAALVLARRLWPRTR